MSRWLKIFSPPPTTMVVFFTFLTISLFLGDGKQPFVDVFMALGILLSFGALFYQKTRTKPLPGKINFLWFILLIYYVISIFFSDSAAYSVSATIRLIEAYLVYEAFYTIASEKTLKLFIGFTVFLVWLAQAFALLFLISPTWARFLPLMNLFYANYGHNHLADLLLIAAPLVFFRWLNKPNWFNLIMLVFFVVGMVLTFARGAWLISLLFFGFQFLTIKKTKLTPGVLKILTLMVIVFFTIIVGLLFLTFNQKVQQKIPVGTLTKQLVKPFPWQDPRIRYWKQAVIAIGERPWFGSGPGTFYLESKRLQASPLSYSWFAHSFPLQSLVELGFIGSTLLFLLLFYHAKIFLKHYKTADWLWRGLFWGLTLTFVYSLFEFNLDFLVIWLLFWAILGLVAGCEQKNTKTGSGHTVILISLLLLLFFYLSSLTSMMVGVLFTDGKLAMYLAPYNQGRTLTYLKNSSSNAPPGILLWSDFTNRRDPETLFELAQTGKRLKFNQTTVDDWYERAVSADRFNKVYHRSYLKYLTETKQQDKAGEALKQASLILVSPALRQEVVKINFSDKQLQSFYQNILPSLVEPMFGDQQQLSKLYYLLGLKMIDKDPWLTEKFWFLARDVTPSWSFFHLELASLEIYSLDNVQLFREIINRCKIIKETAAHCKSAETKLLPQPGSFREYIKLIQ